MIYFGPAPRCPHTLSPGGLVCDRKDVHDPVRREGHTYTPTGGGLDAEPGDPS